MLFAEMKTTLYFAHFLVRHFAVMARVIKRFINHLSVVDCNVSPVWAERSSTHLAQEKNKPIANFGEVLITHHQLMPGENIHMYVTCMMALEKNI